MLDGVKKVEELHHAYLLEGKQEEVLKSLLQFLEGDLKIEVVGNPDVHVRTPETFTIDEARALKALSSEKAIGSSPKIFVTSFENATKEAQNALLKLFEEPTEKTHFFVIVSHAELLLPTLRSRLYTVRAATKEDKSTERAGGFLAADASSRLLMLEEIIKSKDRAGALAFLEEIERALHADTEVVKENAGVLKEIETMRQYLYDRSPSVKMVLEHTSLVAPRTRLEK